MESVLHAAIEGLLQVLSWPNILYPVAGTLLAVLFALMPGLGGVTLMALALPFTLGWEPLPVMLLFGAFLGGATFMGSVSAILLNIPGTGANAATLLDGYPMAQQGRARTAIACSASASALGSTFGVAVLILLIPVMRELVLAFGPPEFFMLAVWGLTTLAALTQGTLMKGLATAGIGLMLAFVGLDPRTAEARYTFGTLYLEDGLSLVPMLLGIFALAQVIDLLASGRRTISGRSRVEELTGSAREGVLAVFRHFGLFVRSSVIGTVIGIIPGVGAAVASFVAYRHAVETGGETRDRFGHGDIRGVLAPEAANDAKDGGSLVPTLAFGIPGGAGTAVFLAVLSVHGLAPGRTMLTDGLPLVFALIWSLFLSNWLTSALGLAAITPLTRLTTIPVRVLAPVVLVAVVVGAYLYRGSVEDVVVTVVAGLFGYALKRYGWPAIPLVIGLVLGRLFETNLHLTLRLEELDRIDFWSRPIALALVVLTAVSLAAPLWQRRHKRTVLARPVAEPVRGGLWFTLVLLASGAVLCQQTLILGRLARMVPEKIVVGLLAVLLVQAILDLRQKIGGQPAEKED